MHPKKSKEKVFKFKYQSRLDIHMKTIFKVTLTPSQVTKPLYLLWGCWRYTDVKRFMYWVFGDKNVWKGFCIGHSSSYMHAMMKLKESLWPGLVHGDAVALKLLLQRSVLVISVT